MKLLVSEDWNAIINSENFSRAEVVSDITTLDLGSEKFRYAIDVWTKDGLVYRLGTYKTEDSAKGRLAYILCNLICDERDILSLIPDNNRPKPIYDESKVLR